MKLLVFIFLTAVLTLNAYSANSRPMSVKRALRLDLWHNGIEKQNYKPKNMAKIPARQKLLWESLERFEQKV